MKDKACVIVDCYSAAVPLARMIAARGYTLIHVQSSASIVFGGASFRPADFALNLVFRDDVAALRAQLEQYDVVACIAGVQTGVVLADSLSELLGVPSNGQAQSMDRVDKFAMYEVLKRNDLLHARTHASSRLDDLLAWFRASRARKVIVKPCTSAGTDNVGACATEQEIGAAFMRIAHKVNRMGLVNEAVLIQEYLEGTEYIVNTVSWSGRHRVTDVWRYRKLAVNGGSFVYEACELLPYTEECVEVLRDYVFRVLDAFGVKEGPAHNEVMLTTAGPALVEINPRLAGAQIPRLAALALGTGQLEWTSRVYLERASLPAGFDLPYTLQQHAMLCPLISNVTGQFGGLRDQREIEALPSFQFADYFVEIGKQLPLTVDCYTQPGIVFLAHPDAAVMRSDFRRIRELENAGLFRVTA